MQDSYWAKHSGPVYYYMGFTKLQENLTNHELQRENRLANQEETILAFIIANEYLK